jgi:cytochrome c-type biogenesis protein CcmH
MWPQAERRRVQSGYVTTLPPVAAPEHTLGRRGRSAPRAGRGGRVDAAADPRSRMTGSIPRTGRRGRPSRTGGGVTRRQFLLALGAGASTSVATGLALSPLGAALGAQAGEQPAAPGVDMSGSGYRPVTLPLRANAERQLTKEQTEALERQLGCACPCTLDVFTCRTTDFSCGISPQMHRDVLRLVEGGYSGDEIVRAFERVYGEAVLMAPKREGFNLAGYWMPFAALGTGAVVVAALIRRWGRRAAEATAQARAASAAGNGSAPHAVHATPDEMARPRGRRARRGRRVMALPDGTLALTLGTAIALAASWVVLRPLLGEDVAPPPPPAPTVGASPARDGASAIEALREIEFDRVTGKLSDTDYAALKATYTEQALAELRAREARRALASGAVPAGAAAPDAGDDPVEAALAEFRARAPRCPEHGVRPQGDAAFCSECGRFLAAPCRAAARRASTRGSASAATAARRWGPRPAWECSRRAEPGAPAYAGSVSVAIQSR